MTRFVESIAALNASFRTRHDILTTFADGPDPKAGDYTVHRLELGRRGLLASMRAARRLFRTYDAVMIHGAHPAVVLPLIGLGRRTFVFQHGMAVSSGGRATRAVKKAWFSIIPWLLRADIVCSTDYALAKSEALGIRFRRARVRIVPFGTDLQRVSAPAGATRDRLTIGMAGRLHSQKRQDLVLRSFEGYDGRLPVTIVIAGDGGEREALERLADRIRSERVEVTFLGNVGDMAPFYDRLDLLVFPSAGESFGLVALEALMRSVPVAVFPDVGGCLPLVRDGETGFVVRPGVEGLRELWRTLNARPELLPEIRARVADEDFSRFGAGRTRAELDRLAGVSAPAAGEVEVLSS